MDDLDIRADKIDLLLRKLHVMSMNPAERKRLALGLAQQQLTDSKVRQVWDECRQSSSSDEQARGLFASKLKEPATVREIYEDLQEKQERFAGKTAMSDLRFVTETNPYGWAEPEAIRSHDHSAPGQWNAFRQSYNLTTEEASDLGVSDVRRHGCSRFEVVDKSGTPSHDWRPGQVDILVEQKAAGISKVYGE